MPRPSSSKCPCTIHHRHVPLSITVESSLCRPLPSIAVHCRCAQGSSPLRSCRPSPPITVEEPLRRPLPSLPLRCRPAFHRHCCHAINCTCCCCRCVAVVHCRRCRIIHCRCRRIVTVASSIAVIVVPSIAAVPSLLLMRQPLPLRLPSPLGLSLPSRCQCTFCCCCVAIAHTVHRRCCRCITSVPSIAVNVTPSIDVAVVLSITASSHC